MQHFDPTKATFKGFTQDFTTNVPLSITLQVTRKCNLKCIYCSEAPGIPDPTAEELINNASKLSGIERIIISGGEPTLRKDLPEILRGLRSLGFPVISMASNATQITPELAKTLSQTLDYMDVTIDGTPSIHNRIRGEFNRVLEGAMNLRNAGLPLCIVTVLLQRNKETLPEVLQLAEELCALRVKIISPIPKGRGVKLMGQTLNSEEIAKLHQELCECKQRKGWNFTITITDWTHVKEGHALLIHPDGEIVASPVPKNPGCILSIGQVQNMDAKEIWARYPYKDNHIQKYFDRSLLVC